MRTIEIDDVSIQLPIEAVDHIDIHKKRLSSGQFVVAYAAHDECAENPIESCDGMGKIIQHNRQSDADETSEMLESNPLVVPLSKFEHGSVIWGVMGSLHGTPDFRWDGTSYAGRWVPDSSCIEHIKSSAIKKLLPDVAKVGYKSKREKDGTVKDENLNIITLTITGGNVGGDPSAGPMVVYERGGYKSFASAYKAAARWFGILLDKKRIKNAERELAIECAAQACKVYTAWCNGETYGLVCAWFDKDGDEIDYDSVWGYCNGDTKYIESEIRDNFESKCEELEKTHTETTMAECVP